MEDFSSEMSVKNFTEEPETHSGSEDSSSGESVSNQQIVGESSGTQKKKKTFNCKLCDKVCSRLFKLRRHMKTHEKPYVCKICKFEKRFSDESQLADHHQNVHTGERFVCEICNKSYTSMGLLQDHMQSHTHDKIFTCQVCNNTFASKGKLMRHTKKAHSGKEIRRINSSVPGYLVDKETSQIQKPVTCDVCKKEFAQIQHLNMHYKIHAEDGEKPHGCGVCNRKFATRVQLNDHQRMKKHVRD